MSFFDEFNHIVPYFVKVNVGKNTQFRIDVDKKSYSNHKGKMIAFYKKAKTIEELEKHGLGEYMEYLPAEQVSIPINIQVTSEEKLIPIFEKTSQYTNKEKTSHEIRIFNQNNKQVGYVSISLTPSGDIYNKTSFYESSDKTESIMHTTYNDMCEGRIIKDDFFEFQKNNIEGTRKVEITQRDGKVVGCSIVEKELESREDVLFQSITDFAKDEKTPKLKKYIASCVVDETEYSKRGGKLIPWECRTLEEDLLEYQETMEKFQQHAKWFKEETGMKFSIEKAIEIGELSYDEQRRLGFLDTRFNNWHYYRLARYLQNERNNRLKDFKGTYIGNILKLTDNGYKACVVTKHQKDEQNYKLYTLIDLTGTSITQGTGMEEYMDIDRDKKYFERLDSADKTPTFVTRVSKEGKEDLILYRGNAICGECPEYEQFVEDFIDPFSEIKPVQISKILNKQKER